MNLALGLLLLAGSGLLASLWWWPGDDPHGGVFALLGAIWILPPATLLLATAGAIRRRWRAWWVFPLLALLYISTFLLGVL
ncbi:hypothetical protein [Longimicrobium terrae]|uniref:Uncharacterized protein n=2 Tax=Longimicrobium terrae TaxID=1639882 RepID=A0A841GU77_9BACT|nr:hypothetical protein [Longimicrobium terrae]MBB4634242.1 hypothetical protein [Longimicrobium terrae]MBB6068868.1 hypothetical protein [Longimicrobium terrae]